MRIDFMRPSPCPSPFGTSRAARPPQTQCKSKSRCSSSANARHPNANANATYDAWLTSPPPPCFTHPKKKKEHRLLHAHNARTAPRPVLMEINDPTSCRHYEVGPSSINRERMRRISSLSSAEYSVSSIWAVPIANVDVEGKTAKTEESGGTCLAPGPS